MRHRLVPTAIVACALCAVTTATATAASTTSTSRFSGDAGGAQTLVRSADGAVSSALGSITASTLGVQAGATAGTLARTAVDRYAPMLGLKAGTQLRHLATRSDASGTTVAFDQVAGGVPVYDGRVLVRVGKTGGAVKAITASVSRQAPTTSTTPTVTPETARATSVAGVADYDVLAEPRLVVYDGVPFGSKPSTLAYVTDVRSKSTPMRKLVFVDAASGAVVDTLDRMMNEKNRTIYNSNGSTTDGSFARGEGDGASGDADVDDAYDGTGATYDYYASTFGRDSYDNAGAELISFVHYGVGYENAGWDGAEMVYGDGFAVLDVTGHELTHAVTERTAGLEYQDQSGALNEALSDMAGWDIDPGDTLMGEDLPIGAIRDIANPGAYGQPATADEYVCTTADHGGVHTNSGIPNKVYANLVSSVGRDTAAQIRYQAQTTYLTPQSSFADARAAFVSAAEDVGADSAATAAAWEAQGVTESWAPAC